MLSIEQIGYRQKRILSQVNSAFLSQRFVNTAFLSRKCVKREFLSRKFINTRSSIAFKDLVDSSIAPHIKPHCKGEGEFSKCGSFGWRFNKFYAEEHSCWCHLALSSASPMLSSLPQPLHAILHPPKPASLCIFTSWPDAWILLGVVRGMQVLGHHSDLEDACFLFASVLCF